LVAETNKADTKLLRNCHWNTTFREQELVDAPKEGNHKFIILCFPSQFELKIDKNFSELEFFNTAIINQFNNVSIY